MEQSDLLRYTIDSLERLKVPYMIVGSFASTTYGEPRMTQDIDIVLELPASLATSFCSEFPTPEFYVSSDAVRDAIDQRFQFNVLHPASGNKIDFILPRSDEWGQTQLLRRQRVRVLPDRDGYTARPEDVILGKLWYYSEGGSDKHLRDIAGMLKISGDRIDRDDISRWAQRLGYESAWNDILKRLANP